MRQRDDQVAAPPHRVVGIGASAGGLEALGDLLAAVPMNTGLAFVVVLHLDRSHASFLTEILAKKTALKVLEATNGAGLEQDCVYVIQPNTTLGVTDGHLVVAQRTEPAGSHMPVDALFKSLAQECGPTAIGVVLSGTGSDGSLGVQAIKGEAGITMAQELATARFDGMPASAINTGCVDLVLPPGEIARELDRIAHHPYFAGERGTRERLGNEDEWKRLFRMLRSMAGVDFGLYKRSTIERRLMRRLALRRMETLDRYLNLLQDDPAELEALYQDFLIRVTSFYRDPSTFEALASDIFPQILKTRRPTDPIRIWVPGCATGEEVYSIAITLIEVLGEAAGSTPVQIFGTDVNAHSIERARTARYVENVAAEIPPERLNRFFVKMDGYYELRKSVRELCIFAEHNVAHDPPFSRLDLVSCRNLLIYLDPVLQRKVLATFHYALNPGRFLLLGPSETIGLSSELFELVDAKRKIYKRASGPRTLTETAADRIPVRRPREVALGGAEVVNIDHLQREADHLLLARFAPAGVLVDDKMNVLQFRGSTGQFLEHQQGTASLLLSKLVRPGLLVELSNAIADARSTAKPVRREHLRHDRPGAEHINVEVIPLGLKPDEMRHFLILFESAPDARGAQPKPRGEPRWRARRRDGKQATQQDLAAALRERDELKQELESTRQYLQAIIEANEAAQEELRSANEEVLSANEEFQSTNEELETAKEELQSSNEELATTNEELRHRNLELSQLNVHLRKARDYSQAIVETARQPLVLVDRDLRVRHANPAFHHTFRVPPGECEGCLFSELSEHAWDIPDLGAALKSVRDRERPTLDVRIETSFAALGRRVVRVEASPVRGDPQHGDLILLSIDDVTDREKALGTVRQQAELLDQSRDAVAVLDTDATIRYWNRGAVELYGWSAEEAIGQRSEALLKTRREPVPEGLPQVLEREGGWAGEQVQTAKDGRELVVDAVYTLVRHAPGAVSVLQTDRDITARKAAEEALRDQDRRKDEFLATLGHELRNPLGPTRNALRLLRDGHADPATVARLHEMIERQVTRLAWIVDDLLDLARITRGQIELHSQPVDLPTLVRNAFDDVRHDLERRHHRFGLDSPPALRIVADPARIEQAIVNVLDNAAKYSPDGSDIDVGLDTLGDRARIRVRDNGRGIAPELLPHVFDLFARGGRAEDLGESGLGLGLTLVKRLVELHGGTVEAASEGSGKGSTFTITLPRGDPERAPEPAAVAAGLTTPPTGVRRILIVEDNPDASESMTMILRAWGYDVDVAPDAPRALERLVAFDPQVVLLDIGLPGMSGYDLARQIRVRSNGRPPFLIAMTGYGTEEDAHMSRETGIDRHLTKPIDLDALHDLLGTP